MVNTTVTKVDSAFATAGPMGQLYLASGVSGAMRLWKDREAGGPSAHTRRDYEVIGYVLKGQAELEIEGQMLQLKAGDSYVVPRGALHKYTIVETFSAVEVTTPPAHLHARDEQNLPRVEPPQTRVTDEGVPVTIRPTAEAQTQPAVVPSPEQGAAKAGDERVSLAGEGESDAGPADS